MDGRGGTPLTVRAIAYMGQDDDDDGGGGGEQKGIVREQR